MSRRTITEMEIALIKAMISRGMKNKDIQFFFNRPERPVNTGRISTIGTGTYSNSREIPEASQSELDKFIQSFPAYEHGVKVTAIRSNQETSAEERAKALFKRNAENDWVLINGETEECECKLDFDPTRMGPVVRAIAGLANNKGGFIFFGVSNGQFKATGIGEKFFKDRHCSDCR